MLKLEASDGFLPNLKQRKNDNKSFETLDFMQNFFDYRNKAMQQCFILKTFFKL